MNGLKVRYGPIVIGVLVVASAVIAFSALFDSVPDSAKLSELADTSGSELTIICTGRDRVMHTFNPDETLVLYMDDDTNADTNGTSVAVAGVDTDIDFVDSFFSDIDADTVDKFFKKETGIKEEFNAFLKSHGCDTSKPDSEGCKILYEKSNLLVKGLTGVIGKHADTDTDTDKDLSAGTLGDKENPLIKAGFDPVLLGCCFAVMAIVAWWQKRRALHGDMIMCASTTGVGTMILPPPVTFGWSMAASAVKKKELALESPPLRVVGSNEEELEEFDEGDPRWREPFRASYLELYREMFADLAHNPALLQRLYEKSLRAHRRDADIIEKAYKETIFN